MGTYRLICEICGTDFEIGNYGDGQCPKCSQRYAYEEGHMIVLTEVQLSLLRMAWRKTTDEPFAMEIGR